MKKDRTYENLSFLRKFRSWYRNKNTNLSQFRPRIGRIFFKFMASTQCNKLPESHFWQLNPYFRIEPQQIALLLTIWQINAKGKSNKEVFYMFAPLAIFGSLGWTEILLILFIALLLFGGKRLPSLAKDLGDGIRSFRKSLMGESDDSSQQIGQEQVQSASKEESKNSKSKKSKSVWRNPFTE